jgi:hypothetical protein
VESLSVVPVVSAIVAVRMESEPKDLDVLTYGCQDVRPKFRTPCGVVALARVASASEKMKMRPLSKRTAGELDVNIAW